MYISIQHVTKERREGVILMIVIILLTLFAILGLTFLLYADAEATASAAYRDAQNYNLASDESPAVIFSYGLGQLIYDVDDNTNPYSAMRGQSLSRDMYGWNSDEPGTSPPVATGTNIYPFNGTGRLHTGSVTYPPTTGITFPDDYNIINYTFFKTSDAFLRDPERLGSRADVTQPRGLYTGGFNTSYTYPDERHMYLGAMRADWTVLAPSFHRASLGFGSLDPTNPNWSDTINKTLKYYLLRPRTVDNDPTFPATIDGGGDVKNLVGAPAWGPTSNWNMDSFWMDIGYPVKVDANNNKVKPLFAFFVMDLDNRINVNVHGNILGPNNTHVSNGGWGKWEVNIGKVLNQDAMDTEWENLLTGLTTPSVVAGRYGSPSGPTGTGGPPPLQTHFYGQVDYNAYNYEVMPNGITPQLSTFLPGGSGGTNALSCFPFPAPNGYVTDATVELTNSARTPPMNHPQFFDYFNPNSPDRTFDNPYQRDLKNMKQILYNGNSGTDYRNSVLYNLCPQNLANARVRNLITTLSMDLDRPAVTPWIWDPTTAPYTDPLGAAPPFWTPPAGNSIAFPGAGTAATLQTLRSANVPANSEFRISGTSGSTADWRANITGLLSRLNLNRDLVPYPTATKGMAPNPLQFDLTNSNVLQQFQAAQGARQQLAKDIYDKLRAVTGVVDPATITTVAQTTTPDFYALQWLAQLSVNIVDFIDSDDISTPFNWITVPTTPSPTQFWVFGTELPRVVINEAYAEYDASAATTKINVWAELYNTFNRSTLAADPSGLNPLPSDTGNAQLNGVYQLALCMPGSGASLRAPTSMTGDVTGLTFMNTVPGTTPAIVTAFTNTPPLPNDYVLNASTSLSGVPAPGGSGFYLVGPGAPFPSDFNGVAGQPNQTLKSPMMHYEVAGMVGTAPPCPTLVLQRLACPYLPLQNNPAMPNYNPYLTVDYFEGVNDDGTGKLNTNQSVAVTNPPTNRKSQGRQEPFAGTIAFKADQTSQATATSPHTSFFLKNDNANTVASGPFHWLVHLDRKLISPMELLQVSAYRPHELTQQFITMLPGPPPTPQFYTHLVPWFDEDLVGGTTSHRLYRAFEYFATSDRAAGITGGGRIPGKININTIWDIETFVALCDPQASNDFTLAQLYNSAMPSDTTTIWGQMLAQRTPALFATPVGGPAPGDRPFWGMATGFSNGADPQYPAGFSVENTFARSFPGTTPLRRLLDVSGAAAAHPYIKRQLFTKIADRVTTRSNVFAVWLTVGFFKVTDDTTLPVKLGAEVVTPAGTTIRHQMFAIVDRSSLTIAPAITGLAADVMQGAQQIRLNKTSDLTRGPNPIPWTINNGSVLVIDPGQPIQETVVVTNVDNTTSPPTLAVQAPIIRNHLAGAAITIPGTPGPQPLFDLRDNNYGPVVPYFAFIN
jgi:hypothetical protein